jgi:hypothetical protein
MFEERLLDELKEIVATRADSGGSARVRSRRRAGLRPTLIAAAAMVAAGAAVAVLADGTTPAAAVVREPDGTLTVHLDDYTNPKPVERELRKFGVRATVDFLPDNQICHYPRGKRSGDPRATTKILSRVVDTSAFNGSGTFRIHPDQIPSGQTLVIELTGGRKSSYGIGYELHVGDVLPCVLEPIPTPTSPTSSISPSTSPAPSISPTTSPS